MSNSSSNIPQPRRRIGLFKSLLLLLVLGGAGWTLMLAVLAPWNFYYGGHFHLVPGWQGWGRLHADTAGGDYFLWLRLDGTLPQYRQSSIKGVAYLCTPRGERFTLRVSGGPSLPFRTDTVGLPLHLTLNNTMGIAYNFTNDKRPHVDLKGSFGDSRLTMEEGGSLARDFGPDGRLRDPHAPSRPAEKIPVVFKEGSPWVLHPHCPSADR